MNFRIIVNVQNNKETPEKIDVTISRTGKVAQKDGAIAGALQFAITQQVREILTTMEKNNGKAIS